ncbi:hypothetical protein BDV41DRAFT_539493 [Aspergillus transmontanensis]|uniref:Uncharacterized protein n=1 Tax=Aspergillus transmontanensis TaxID=1034304 RepID=A0A5N6VYK0_9EURO|nr:hypothetical protein BDV41DRAFT_539493 [Aspergillus transmontanensis]
MRKKKNGYEKTAFPFHTVRVVELLLCFFCILASASVLSGEGEVWGVVSGGDEDS